MSDQLLPGSSIILFFAFSKLCSISSLLNLTKRQRFERDVGIDSGLSSPHLCPTTSQPQQPQPNQRKFQPPKGSLPMGLWCRLCCGIWCFYFCPVQCTGESQAPLVVGLGGQSGASWEGRVGHSNQTNTTSLLPSH